MHESGGKLISTFSNHSEMELPDPWKFCDNIGAFEIPDPWKFWREPKTKQKKISISIRVSYFIFINLYVASKNEYYFPNDWSVTAIIW